ncbi:MAG: hypothetical protein CVV24_03885 [Ignavibacteriae bacterium HGW-Ignavibacteriae-3]|nr:MAG: hypothetical protein CVV24_03885 [Ignavibacteriae bacterium HGW-Ignavibacteriae-3]
MIRTTDIRKWNVNDVPGVRDVLQLSWQKAYSSFILQEDLDFYLNKTYSEESLIELCQNSEYSCFVAENEGEIVGWLKLNENKSENRFYLSSIYVLPEFQKMQIGEKFFLLSCREAVKKGYLEIYVGVMEQNLSALKWYQKLGFIFFEEQPFKMGNSSVLHLIGRKIFNK